MPVHFLLKFCQVVGATVIALSAAAWVTHVVVHASMEAPSIHLDNTEAIWDVNIAPSDDATSHLVFNTVSSLLQHWPNTRYRNGHTIVPGIVPLGTLLYHGRSDSLYPNGSDWTSTDPEHSFLFCKGTCWHLTLVTTRPLKVLYFDGSSAVKMQGGSMDTQDILLWGKPRADKVFSEVERLEELCKWGSEFGLDGFVRMEMDFEVMLCDFSAGVETVSFLHLANSSPGDPVPTDDASSSDIDEAWSESNPNPAVTIRNFELMHSSSQHNQYPGESRVQLDLTRLVSFYDLELAPSLVPLRRSANVVGGRWGHGLHGIKDEDVARFRHRLKEVLSSEGRIQTNSGVDWNSIFQVVMKRYGSRLETLQYVLGAELGTASLGDDEDRIRKAFAQLNVMLTPYIVSGTTPAHKAEQLSSGNPLTWASPVYQLCSTSHTSYISSSAVLNRMTSSERLLLASVRDTTREICRVLVKMWATGKEAGFDEKYWRRLPRHIVESAVEPLLEKWRSDLGHLMEWLDWHMWVKCQPPCGPEEMCYMPTWPYFGGPPPAPVDNLPVTNSAEAHDNEWERPQPKCIKRIAPYSF